VREEGGRNHEAGGGESLGEGGSMGRLAGLILYNDQCLFLHRPAKAARCAQELRLRRAQTAGRASWCCQDAAVFRDWQGDLWPNACCVLVCSLARICMGQSRLYVYYSTLKIEMRRVARLSAAKKNVPRINTTYTQACVICLS
jgi:hypothetical protein